jgi:hypothetical protein
MYQSKQNIIVRLLKAAVSAKNFRWIAVAIFALAVIGCPQAPNPEALKKQEAAEKIIADNAAKNQADAEALKAEVAKMKGDAAAKTLADAEAKAKADELALAEADKAVAAAEAEAKIARAAAQSNRSDNVSRAKADRAEAAPVWRKGIATDSEPRTPN